MLKLEPRRCIMLGGLVVEPRVEGRRPVGGLSVVVLLSFWGERELVVAAAPRSRGGGDTGGVAAVCTRRGGFEKSVMAGCTAAATSVEEARELV